MKLFALGAEFVRALPFRWRLFYGFLLLINVLQCSSLLKRVTRGATDFTVFYNSSQLLLEGAGAEFYAARDASTNWLRVIPPFGQMVFTPFALGSIQTAAVLWAIFHLVLLGLSLVALWYFARHLDGKARVFTASLPAMGAVLLALSPGSIQVGQFSVLFTACWIGFLALCASRWKHWASGLLAIPAGIKIYPIVLCGVFLFQRRWAALAVALFFTSATLAAPALIYGARVPELTRSFWQNAIASNDSRIRESQRANSAGNQGIDSIFLRYLSSGQKLQARHPSFRHLDFERSLVVKWINFTRFLVFALTFWVAWRAWPRLQRSPLWGTFWLMALGSACLYVLIPGTKSRYAVYTALAFGPLVLQAVAAKKQGNRRRSAIWTGTIFFLVLLTVQMVPPVFRLYGVPFFGHCVLWACNLALLWRLSGRKTAREKRLGEIQRLPRAL